MRKFSPYQHPKIYYRPQPRVKEARPRQKKRLLLIFFILLLIGLSWFLFFSPFFRIEQVYVQGNTIITKESIKEKIQFPHNRNIFLLRSSTLQKQLLGAFPVLESVAVKKNIFPHPLLVIQLVEKKPSVLWRVQNKVFALDAMCVVAMEYPIENPEQAVVISSYPWEETKTIIGEKVCEPTLPYYAQTLFSKVQAIMHTKNVVIEAIDMRDFQFVVEGKLLIKFTIDKNPIACLDKLQTIYDHMKKGEITIQEYIDLRTEQVHTK